VIDAVVHYLAHTNANHGGLFATSRESDAALREAHAALATFLGADDPGEVVFGANMTSLTFALSRALARTWRPGDEIVVTRLDHDANVTPWVLAARDAGATVHSVGIRAEDCTLDMNDFRRKLSHRTRLVAVACASNAVGTINPIAEIVQLAHQAGALAFLDAVHYAPHALLDVRGWDCDFLACSAYKFFGPHLGILWGRRRLLETLPVYKVRPAADELPDRWMTGTQSHEAIVGARAAIAYLSRLGHDRGTPDDPRSAIVAAYDRIGAHERTLLARLVAGLESLPDVKVWGITDRQRFSQRLPTVAITHRRFSPRELAQKLAKRGVFTWHGNFYALPLTEALGLEPEGLLRIGLLHYNTAAEVDYLLEILSGLD
jgi:cysteine desulfurase family protein (TIGR01976 family)